MHRVKPWILCFAAAIFRLASAGTPAPDPVTSPAPIQTGPAATTPAPTVDGPKNAADAKPAAPPPKTLYMRVGGAAKIADIGDDFVERLTKDAAFTANAQVKKALAEVSVPALRFYVTALLCQVCRGPEVYGGQPIHEIYLRLKLSDDEWKTLMADFDKALEQAKLAADDKKELLAEVTSVRAQLADVISRIFEEKGVFFVVPAGWERLKAEEPGTLLHAAGPKPANGGERPALRVALEEFAPGLEMSSKEYMKANQFQMSKTLPNFRAASTQSLAFKNDPVEALAYQYNSGKTEFSSETFFLVKNKRGYTIQFMGPKESFEQSKPVFNDVLRSLRID